MPEITDFIFPRFGNPVSTMIMDYHVGDTSPLKHYLLAAQDV